MVEFLINEEERILDHDHKYWQPDRYTGLF